MEKRGRVFISFLCLGVLILLGLVFQRFVFTSIIEPAATVVWLFLRMFVLSIDQKVYWWCAIALALVVMLVRLAWGQTVSYSRLTEISHAPRDQAGLWRTSILRGEETAATAGGGGALRRDLMWLFTEMYASQRHGDANFKIREAFQERSIPLPETLHSFLFAQKPPEPHPHFTRHPILFVRRSLRSVEDSLRAWISRHTGRARMDYLASIEEVATFMENYLEMKDDDTASHTPRP